MLLSYVTTIVRHLQRKSFYYGVNIFGLSLGLSVTALIILYVHHELTFDKFHPHSDTTYRISGKRNDTWFASLSAPYSNALYDSEFAGVEKVVRLRRWLPKYLRHGNNKFFEDKVLITDTNSEFFNLFNFHLLKGQAIDALKKPNSIVITRKLALKIFGDREPLGETIQFDSLNLTVTAVLLDIPSNTHMDFEALITNDQMMEQANGMFTYCRLSSSPDLLALKKQLLGFQPPLSRSAQQDIVITPIQDLHYDGNLTFEMKPPANKSYLLIFIIVGVMILVLSLFNYINLALAVYAERTKEIGIRKAAGASRNNLSFQFFSESILHVLLCFPIALAIVQIALPSFNDLMGTRLQNEFIHSLKWFSLIAGITLLLGLTVGFYPARILSRLNTNGLFKNNNEIKGSLKLRTVLVSLQIAIVVFMLSSGLIIHFQLDYLDTKDLGFTREGIIKLKGASNVDQTQFEKIKSSLLAFAEVETVSQGITAGDEDYGITYRLESIDQEGSDLILVATDYDYIKTLGLHLLQTDFDPDSKHPERLVLINETFAKRLNKSDAIGEKVTLFPGKDYETTKVINGVFKDFHFYSLHQEIPPMIMVIRPFGDGVNENILVRVNSSDLSATIDKINKITASIITDTPLVPQFLEDDLARLYDEEKRLAFVSNTLLIIASFLSVLGLLGLVSYIIQRKTKEIGIRKVLGASKLHILKLLSRSIALAAMVSFIAGSAISFFLGSKWLDNFTYKIIPSWSIYSLTGLGLLTLLLTTVGLQTWMASRANPVESLRSE